MTVRTIILCVLRTLLTYFSRGVVLRRYLPLDFNSLPIHVSPEASLGLWKRNLETFDPFLFLCARSLIKRGDVVWDIGANVGLFSFAAAAQVGSSGSVLAVEPDAFLAGLLRRSALENCDTTKVEVVEQAVSDQRGVVEFNISQRGRCSNFVTGFGTGGGTRKAVSVPCTSLDDLLTEGRAQPKVVKIDIEGMDHIALRGAHNMLRHRPILILEVTDATREETGRTLASYDYHIFDAALKPARKMPFCNLVAMAA